jgi:2-succinyl-6-hydroxy-2,4-cyclohexadiene-1-carboxylate synthase
MSARLFALHGFAGSPATFDALARALPGTELIAPHLLGHGAESEASSFDEEVDRLAALVPAGPTTLLGYSLGGRLGLALLARGVPFARAVIIGGAPGLATPSERIERRHMDARWASILRSDGVHAFAEAWEAQPLFATQKGTKFSARRAQRRAHDAEGLARAFEVLGLAEMPNLLPALARNTVPVDYVVGERDAKFIALGEALVASVPNVRLTVAAGAGHDVLLEAEAEVVNVLLRGPARIEE